MNDTDLLKLDLSKATELKIDNALSDNRVYDLIKELIHYKEIEIAREYDKAVIKSAFLKAKLYDKTATLTQLANTKNISKYKSLVLGC